MRRCAGCPSISSMAKHFRVILLGAIPSWWLNKIQLSFGKWKKKWFNYTLYRHFDCNRILKIHIFDNKSLSLVANDCWALFDGDDISINGSSITREKKKNICKLHWLADSTENWSGVSPVAVIFIAYSITRQRWIQSQWQNVKTISIQVHFICFEQIASRKRKQKPMKLQSRRKAWLRKPRLRSFFRGSDPNSIKRFKIDGNRINF